MFAVFMMVEYIPSSYEWHVEEYFVIGYDVHMSAAQYWSHIVSSHAGLDKTRVSVMQVLVS